MIRAFVDASVLFAAAYSPTGSARDLLRQAIREQVKLVVSQDVLNEAERNLRRKSPEGLTAYQALLPLVSFEVVDGPSKEAVWAAEKYVAQKDAPIIAAAIQARPDYLVTYDHKHLLDRPEVAEKSGLNIVEPAVVVELVRQEFSNEED